MGSGVVGIDVDGVHRIRRTQCNGGRPTQVQNRRRSRQNGFPQRGRGSEAGLKRRADVVIARGQPIEPVFSKIVRPRLAYGRQHSSIGAIFVAESTHARTLDRFPILVIYASRNRTGWNQTDTNILNLLTGDKNQYSARTIRANLAILLVDIPVTLDMKPVASRLNVREKEPAPRIGHSSENGFAAPDRAQHDTRFAKRLACTALDDEAFYGGRVRIVLIGA